MEFLQAKQYVREALGIGNSVADELLTLSGCDPEMVIACSRTSNGLDQCKAKIINERIGKIEAELDKWR